MIDWNVIVDWNNSKETFSIYTLRSLLHYRRSRFQWDEKIFAFVRRTAYHSRVMDSRWRFTHRNGEGALESRPRSVDRVTIIEQFNDRLWARCAMLSLMSARTCRSCCENSPYFYPSFKRGDIYFSQVIEAFRIYLRKKKKEKKILIEVREYSVSGVRGEGASSKRWRVWGSKTGWPTMSASMRSTLQTVPESVPADHVTNSKVSTKKIYGKTKILLNSCNRNCSLEDEMARRVFFKNVCEMRNFASRARSISKPQ